MPAHVAFIGLGYIGLPTAVVMANSGLSVTGVDVAPEKVESINRGEVTIVEPGLEAELRSALESGRFTASVDMPQADAYIIAVPTPFTEDRDVDMKFIYSAATAIAPKLRGGELVILESTSPPRTTERLAQKILKLRPDLRLDGASTANDKPVVYFAHCPERILPGKAMEELRTNDRIIGGMSPEATAQAKEIYSTFCRGELLETNDRTAELAKLTENSFRDVNIAFANELSLICDQLGINVWELIELANHHPRVNILQPGPGVGGHCIAVDPWFIVSAAPEAARLIRMSRDVNDSKPGWVVQKIRDAVQRVDGNPAIALLGLSFKPDIDDLRESPAVEITEKLANLEGQCEILAVEPNVDTLPPQLASLSNVRFASADEALNRADVVALLVDHREFREIPVDRLEGKQVIDTRGVWQEEAR